MGLILGTGMRRSFGQIVYSILPRPPKLNVSACLVHKYIEVGRIFASCIVSQLARLNKHLKYIHRERHLESNLRLLTLQYRRMRTVNRSCIRVAMRMLLIQKTLLMWCGAEEITAWTSV